LPEAFFMQVLMLLCIQECVGVCLSGFAQGIQKDINTRKACHRIIKPTATQQPFKGQPAVQRQVMIPAMQIAQGAQRERS
jgi:hypothetical protein